MRIDKEMVSRNLVPSRTKAQELIKSKLVLCNGKIIDKTSYSVNENDIIDIKSNEKLKYVSRGGLKLEKALDTFNIDFNGLKIMDIGSSTGGFCDCALKHGVKSIVAVDVGTNLMHESLRNNKQIDLHEKTNFKDFDSKYFKNIDAIVCDVSFISKGFYVKNLTSSPIRGGDGNIEYLAYISNKINQNEKIDIKKLVLTSFMNKTI